MQTWADTWWEGEKVRSEDGVGLRRDYGFWKRARSPKAFFRGEGVTLAARAPANLT